MPVMVSVQALCHRCYLTVKVFITYGTFIRKDSTMTPHCVGQNLSCSEILIYILQSAKDEGIP